MANTLSERLRLARYCQGMTQKALADTSGLSRQTIHSLEAGRKFPKAPTALILATTLRVSVSWLMNGMGTGPQDATPVTSKGPVAAEPLVPSNPAR